MRGPLATKCAARLWSTGYLGTGAHEATRRSGVRCGFVKPSQPLSVVRHGYALPPSGDTSPVICILLRPAAAHQATSSCRQDMLGQLPHLAKAEDVRIRFQFSLSLFYCSRNTGALHPKYPKISSGTDPPPSQLGQWRNVKNLAPNKASYLHKRSMATIVDSRHMRW